MRAARMARRSNSRVNQPRPRRDVRRGGGSVIRDPSVNTRYTTAVQLSCMLRDKLALPPPSVFPSYCVLIGIQRTVFDSRLPTATPHAHKYIAQANKLEAGPRMRMPPIRACVARRVRRRPQSARHGTRTHARAPCVCPPTTSARPHLYLHL